MRRLKCNLVQLPQRRSPRAYRSVTAAQCTGSPVGESLCGLPSTSHIGRLGITGARRGTPLPDCRHVSYHAISVFTSWGFITALLLMLVVPGPAWSQSRWSVEAESADVQRASAVADVPDPAASGGHALSIPVDGVPAWNVVWMPMPTVLAPGRYRLTSYIALENSSDIGKAWRVDVRNGDALLGHGTAYGLYLRGKGYQPFTVSFDVADASVHPGVYMRWTGQEGRPTLKIDRFEIERTGDLPRLRVVQVWPDRIRYKTTETGTVTVTVRNSTQTQQHALLQLELQHDLDSPRIIGSKPIAVGPEASQDIRFEMRHGGGLFGYVVRARLISDSKEIDSGEEFFCVHDNPWAVATGARDEDLPDYYVPWYGAFYGISASDPEIEQCALQARREYTTYTEFFAWSPGEAFDLSPKESVWIRGNGGDQLRSKHELQREIAALHAHGIGCISYIAFQAMGESALRLLSLHPEWFVYSPSTGDHVEFYDIHQLASQRAFWASFDRERCRLVGDTDSPSFARTNDGWKAYKGFWQPRSTEVAKLSSIGYFDPNYSLPEVVDYCADQVIASARMFGWDGLRWDCGNLNTGPIWGEYHPFIDFQGREVAKSAKEMTQQTIKNLDRLRSRILKSRPGFVFGTNFGSVGETQVYPDLTAKLASNGGWILDEYAYAYNLPQSPYHWWDKYYAVMADQGEYITSLGGHYNPFSFNRSGGKYPSDRLYETIFRLVGKGHPNVVYYNSSTPAGNYAQFSVRFGRFLFDTNLRRVANPEQLVSVTSSSPIWWRKSVQRLRSASDEFLVVHLINPPTAKEAETDPNSRLNPPVSGVQVGIRVPPGKSVTACALTAESWRTGDAPRTQSIPLKTETRDGRAWVTVPQVLYWKTVVFRLR